MAKPILMLFTLALLLASSCTLAAHAYVTEGSLASGYYITANLPEDQTPGGSTITVTAQTTNTRVAKITFHWKNPAGSTVWTDTVTVQPDGTYEGKTVYSAESVHSPMDHGDWQVNALFLTADDFCLSQSNIAPSIRTTFFVVPEIPIVGTAGAALAMFAGLAIKMKSKPKN